MRTPLISIIIPAYNNADFLGDAIESVLNQTYPHFELVIVNDASPDNSEEIVMSFQDERIKYLVHPKNKGLSATRNTGIRNSSGEYIAILDGDDYFHPDKLKAHAKFFEKHPDVDVTYNARIELDHSSDTIRELWRPPLTVDLSDLILYFPFAPSDMVIRRDRLFQVGLFDERYTYFGEDLDINCKLALEGCNFASVDRVLNYRRHHSNRFFEDIRSCQEDETLPLYTTFSDPRFPESLQHLKNIALSNRFIFWSFIAYSQKDISLGKEYATKAVNLNPSLLEGRPCKYLDEILQFSILDKSNDHVFLIKQIVSRLPKELESLADQSDLTIARGFLIKGIRATFWGSGQEAETQFGIASKHGIHFDEHFFSWVSTLIISYEAEFGSEKAEEIVNKLSSLFEYYGKRADARALKSNYSVNTAFRDYKAREFALVPQAVIRTILNKPSYLFNRGLISIFARSILKRYLSPQLEE